MMGKERRWDRWALGLGGAGLLVGLLLIAWFPQRPNGDRTSLLHFDARYGSSPLHVVQGSFPFHAAGALAAWGALARLLRIVAEPGPRRRRLPRTLFWAALLVAWTGWAWNATRGWQGELFLERGFPTPLGVDRAPVIRFEGFRVPPAPDGPGRALALDLWVDDVEHRITEAQPWRGREWTLQPRWYGATVSGSALAGPRFFGASGNQSAPLRGGGSAQVWVDVEALTVQSEPPVPGLVVMHYAILRARFAPGDGLLRSGLVLALVVGLWRGVQAAPMVRPPARN